MIRREKKPLPLILTPTLVACHGRAWQRRHHRTGSPPAPLPPPRDLPPPRSLPPAAQPSRPPGQGCWPRQSWPCKPLGPRGPTCTPTPHGPPPPGHLPPHCRPTHKGLTPLHITPIGPLPGAPLRSKDHAAAPQPPLGHWQCGRGHPPPPSARWKRRRLLPDDSSDSEGLGRFK